MKTLSDGVEVSSRSYYFLLDWNERDEWYFIRRNFDKQKLMELTISEYTKLWKHASETEHNNLLNKIK